VGKHKYAVLVQELTFMAAGQGVEVRYQKPFVMPLMISEALKNCCVNGDSHSVLREEICGTPDFFISEQSVLF
jgi:hypothetical protein